MLKYSQADENGLHCQNSWIVAHKVTIVRLITANCQACMVKPILLYYEYEHNIDLKKPFYILKFWHHKLTHTYLVFTGETNEKNTKINFLSNTFCVGINFLHQLKILLGNSTTLRVYFVQRCVELIFLVKQSSPKCELWT